jgi:hypothetical protein
MIRIRRYSLGIISNLFSTCINAILAGNEKEKEGLNTRPGGNVPTGFQVFGVLAINISLSFFPVRTTKLRCMHE